MDSNATNHLHDWSLDNDIIETEELKTDDIFQNDVPVVVHEEEPESLIKQLNLDEVSDEALDYSLHGEHKPNLLSDLIDEDISDILEDDELSVPESIEVNPFDGLPYSSTYFELLKKRHRLPVWRAKDDFVLAVDESSIVLVTGRAGSGKSTQIPQWCVQFARESKFQFGTVVCSQPSSHAAMSLAIQVAREMDFTEVGNEIGYKVPQIDCTCQHTILTFTTDDILLREMADDPLLEKYNFVIIDEVQERTIATDLLLTLFKSMQNARDDLKVIITSLSHEMEKLEEFFEEVPVIDLHFLEEEKEDSQLFRTEDEECLEAFEKSTTVENKEVEEKEVERRERAEEERLKGIQINYLPTDPSSLVTPVVDLIVKLHCDETITGDFIAFLPTTQEIEEVSERVAREIAIKSLRGGAGEIVVAVLHNSLSPGGQQIMYDRRSKVYNEHTHTNKRRLIISSEIAESCFSTETIKVVIDSGVKEEEVFNCRTRTRARLRKHISHNSALLRSSRCSYGGQVFRMYSELELEEMIPFSIPSIKRVELTSYILLLKRLLQRLNMSFSRCQFLDPPDPEAYMLALEELDYHGALDENGNLSDLGAVMSEFPLPLPHAKCVIASCGEDCVQEMLTIVAMATSSPCWSIPRNFQNEAIAIQRQMAHKAGDHFTLLNMFHRFLRQKRSEAWCLKHYISFDAMKSAEKKREELLSIMERLELPISEPIADVELLVSSVKRALLAGFFMQVARDTDGCGNYLIIRDKHIARIDPQSTSDRDHEWILYDDFLLTQTSHVTMVSSVSPQWVAEITPHSYITNLPSGETKDLLVKLSRRWRKQLAQAEKETSESSTKNELSSSEVNLQTQRTNVQHDRPTSKRELSGKDKNGSSFSSSRDKSNPTKSNDYDDTDVLTQAARTMTQAYHHAADYVSSMEGEESGDQCVVQ